MLTRREVFPLPAAALGAPARTPTVAFGKHTISRLLVGGNPVSGNSHWSAALDQEMVHHFNAANVKKLLRRCEELGINTWQSRGDRHIIRLLTEYRDEGGTIQWIAQTASELADTRRNIREIAAARAIGAYLHGTRTDAMFRAGKIEDAREILKMMRDAGLRAGIGTHMPEVIDHIESRGWDADFYMTCLHNLTRPKEEAEKLNGGPVEGELFHDPDRARMLDRVRNASRQCLVFKVYGAGRKCGSRAALEGAWREVVVAARDQDCFVVGMWLKYKDQVGENAELFAQAQAAHRSPDSAAINER